MDFKQEIGNATSSSVVSKINTYKSRPSTRYISIPLLDKLTGSNVKIENDSNLQNSFDIYYILKIIRYILVIYLVSYIILIILNHYDLLPEWLKEIFLPYNIINKFYTKKDKKEDENNNDNLATSYKTRDNIKDEDKNTISETIPSPPLLQPGNSLPKPDNSTSNTQTGKIVNKQGYCYIGEDKGFRSCLPVKYGDKCMSGDIFPTEAVCINPSLRP